MPPTVPPTAATLATDLTAKITAELDLDATELALYPEFQAQLNVMKTTCMGATDMQNYVDYIDTNNLRTPGADSYPYDEVWTQIHTDITDMIAAGATTGTTFTKPTLSIEQMKTIVKTHYYP